MTNEELLAIKDYDTLYKQNYPYLCKCARSYFIKDDFEERLSLCNLAFTKALNAYDPSKEHKFIAYLSTCITDVMYKEIKYRNAKKRQIETISLNTQLYGEKEDLSLETVISDGTSIEDFVIAHIHLKEKLESISQDLKEVLSLRAQGLKQKDIAKRLDISQVKVSRSLAAAKKLMMEV